MIIVFIIKDIVLASLNIFHAYLKVVIAGEELTFNAFSAFQQRDMISRKNA